MEKLIQELLVKDNEKRLGYGENGYKDLKAHKFFEGVNWQS